jgi:rfaE bifunctional protein kinase chain/domain
MNFEQLFEAFKGKKVAVVGDVMLDTYWWGHVERISPEAPVPVVAVDTKEYRIGGAGNVALNTVALGAQTFIISVIGADTNGDTLTKLYQEQHINTQYLLASTDRITTNKIRIISRNQQMMRLDEELTTDISADLQAQVLQQVELCIANDKPDVVIFEDYNKGVLTEGLITQLIALCQANGIVTTVDPKRKNFFAYKGVDMFKPNLKEVKEGLNISLDAVNTTTLSEVHTQLQKHLHHHISFITLSEKGVFYKDATEANIIPTHIRNIADVSGAGDTVIAVASLVYATTNNMNLAAEMANIAGGLVCEEVGTAAINRQKLLKECTLLLG